MFVEQLSSLVRYQLIRKKLLIVATFSSCRCFFCVKLERNHVCSHNVRKLVGQSVSQPASQSIHQSKWQADSLDKIDNVAIFLDVHFHVCNRHTQGTLRRATGYLANLVDPKWYLTAKYHTINLYRRVYNKKTMCINIWPIPTEDVCAAVFSRYSKPHSNTQWITQYMDAL